jgi:excisionase family DNA binding protein
LDTIFTYEANMRQNKHDKAAPSWLVPIGESIRDSASVDQTAEALGVTPKTVRLWIEEGHLQTILVGKRRMITEAALKKFLSATAVS